MEEYNSNETLIFQGILAALVLLALPFLLGFLRKGFLHVAASVVLLAIYFVLFGSIYLFR